VVLGHEPDPFQHRLFGLDGVDRSTFAVEQVTHGNHALSPDCPGEDETSAPARPVPLSRSCRARRHTTMLVTRIADKGDEECTALTCRVSCNRANTICFLLLWNVFAYPSEGRVR